MLRIQNKNIHINRGDAATIKLSSNVNFAVGDVLKLYVTSAGSLTDIKLTKTKTITSASTFATIDLLPEDTRFLPTITKPQTFWYEIELNGEITLVGYDVTGPKNFVIYPEVVEGVE